MQDDRIQARDSASRPRTIRAHLVALALAAVVPLAAAAGYVIVDRYRESRSQAEGELRNLAAITASNLDREVAESERLLKLLAQRPLVSALDPARCDPFLAEFLALHPEFANLLTRTLRGESVCALLPYASPRDTAAAFPWFRDGVRRARFTAGDAFLGPSSGRWVSVLTYPLHDADGTMSGLLVLPLDLLKLQAQVLPAIPGNVVVSVIDAQDRFVMRSADPAQWIGKPVVNVQLASAARDRGDGIYRVPGVDGVSRVIAYQTNPRTGWLVTVGIPEDTLFAPVRDRIIRAIVLVLATLAFALLLARRYRQRHRETDQGPRSGSRAGRRRRPGGARLARRSRRADQGGRRVQPDAGRARARRRRSAHPQPQSRHADRVQPGTGPGDP